MRIRNLAAAVALTAGLAAIGAGTATATADGSVQAIAGPTPYANYAPATTDGTGAARTADFTPNR